MKHLKTHKLILGILGELSLLTLVIYKFAEDTLEAYFIIPAAFIIAAVVIIIRGLLSNLLFDWLRRVLFEPPEYGEDRRPLWQEILAWTIGIIVGVYLFWQLFTLWTTAYIEITGTVELWGFRLPGAFVSIAVFILSIIP